MIPKGPTLRPRHLRLLVLTTALLAPCIAAAQSDKPVPDRPQDVASMNRQSLALAERGPAQGWNVTPSGLRWRRVAGNGSGRHPGATDKVTVHYAGSFIDGTEFDSSIKRGEPATFPLNRVIKGWQEGVQLMGVGDKVEFAIPQDLAYGPNGRGPIPGGATLLFTVELLAIQPADAATAP